MSTRPTPRLGAGLIAVALGGSVIGSLGAPLITSVARDLGVSAGAAQWTLTIALFSGALAGPVLGRLAGGAHRRQAILWLLVLVTVGGVLAALPLPFWALLAGRVLQGLGIGVTAMLMGVARDNLEPEHSGSTIAMLSVCSTVGNGVGYPLIGLVDQVGGLRLAYALGLLISIITLVIAWRVIPDSTRDSAQGASSAGIDWPGTGLLAVGILGVLLLIAQPTVWSLPWAAAMIVIVTVAALAIWIPVELKCSSPLVNLRLLARPSLVATNSGMLIIGIALYLLFSTFTRYVQTPADAAYGFALPGVVAGAMLIPFSVLGFVAGKVAPGALKRMAAPAVLAFAGLSVAISAILFAAFPQSFVAVLISMAVLGFGVGGVSAAMPGLVLTGVPASETASVLSINQIVRSIGFSIGSAIAGAILAGATVGGGIVPAQRGYVTAALWALPLVVVGVIVTALSSRKRASS